MRDTLHYLQILLRIHKAFPRHITHPILKSGYAHVANFWKLLHPDYSFTFVYTNTYQICAPQTGTT